MRDRFRQFLTGHHGSCAGSRAVPGLSHTTCHLMTWRRCAFGGVEFAPDQSVGRPAGRLMPRCRLPTRKFGILRRWPESLTSKFPIMNGMHPVNEQQTAETR